MSTATLLVSAGFGALNGIVYLYVGRRLAGRQVSDYAGLAQGLFVLWWAALGASSLLGAVQILLYVSGWLPGWLHDTVGSLSLLLIVIGLWGLLYYLVFLYTGRRGAWAPLAAFYLLFYAAIEGLTQFYDRPTTLSDNGWNIVERPVVELPDVTLWLFLLFLVGPQIGAAFAYLRLYGKAQDATQRYRIGMVSGSIIVWFGSALVAGLADIGAAAAWQITSRFLALAAALAILAAYLPPRALRDRYGIRGIAEDDGQTPEDAARAAGSPPPPREPLGEDEE